ncbi:MAG: alpha-D-glucose phosphate-specific phosphoglucomutase, partial [Bryobacteraceae bacterium]
SLLDAGLATLCGEESAGTGSSHVREKDGLWAVLLWLNILAAKQQSVAEIVRAHWREFGRTFYARHDYDEISADGAAAMFAALGARLPELGQRRLGSFTVEKADDFAYRDPVDGTYSAHQGLRLLFEGGARLVYRLSGTGTEGATLRVYLERYEPDPARHDQETGAVLSELSALSRSLADIERYTGRTAPSVVT